MGQDRDRPYEVRLQDMLGFLKVLDRAGLFAERSMGDQIPSNPPSCCRASPIRRACSSVRLRSLWRTAPPPGCESGYRRRPPGRSASRPIRNSRAPFCASSRAVAEAMAEVAPRRDNALSGHPMLLRRGCGRDPAPETRTEAGVDVFGEVAPTRIRRLKRRAGHAGVFGRVAAPRLRHHLIQGIEQAKDAAVADRKIHRQCDPRTRKGHHARGRLVPHELHHGRGRSLSPIGRSEPRISWMTVSPSCSGTRHCHCRKPCVP